MRLTESPPDDDSSSNTFDPERLMPCAAEAE